MRTEHTDDSYDELLILARDSRASRRRTNSWTTGLVITGMAASTIYVGTVNQQMDQLEKASNDTAETNDNLTVNLRGAEAEIVALKIQRDVFKEIANQIGVIKIAEAMPDVITVTGGAAGETTMQFAFSNVVWILDGSRRVPMTDGDILWIPEGHVWLEKNSEEGQDFINLYEEDPADPVSVGRRINAPPGNPHRMRNLRESFNCLEITLHDHSNRPGFKEGNYVDIEVLYSKDDNCSP